MKRYIAYTLLTLIVASCSSPDKRFRIEGTFKNFNQGELYIYSRDRGLERKDTIRLSDGRFAYETLLADSATYSIIFPNYSEIPVFAQTGATVKMEGDASHLKEVEVKGTEENELMTEFRLSISEKTPPEVLKAAETFVADHPKSAVSQYLISKYFLLKPDPDYKWAHQLVSIMSDAAPTNDRLHQQKRQLALLMNSTVGNRLPEFSAVGIDGRKVNNEALKAELNVILVWGSWNFDALNMQRQLKFMKQEFDQRLTIIGICLDASLRDCRQAMNRDSIKWPTVCDGKMWQSPVVEQLCITDLPGNIITDRNGKIIARDLDLAKLREKIRLQLK